jgi:hypothetical protein
MSVFFPTLTRQANYPKRADGNHYSYTYYRDHVATDCQHRCVYCDALEVEVGGAEAMQLDHFRPESFPEFEHLGNDPRNIHYACPRCNLWKSDKWPARGTPNTHNGTEGFVDPFIEDRLTYFSVRPDGQIEPLRHPAKYMIGLLHLQREFLRKLREKRLLMFELRAKRDTLKAELEADLLAGQRADPKKMLDFLEAWERIEALLN